MEVQGPLGECIKLFIRRLNKVLCPSHDHQREDSVLKQRISMAHQIDKEACVLGIVSNRDAFDEINYIYNFSKHVNYCSSLRFRFYRSTVRVAVMSSLLVVFLLLIVCDSGWFGVPYFRCRPRACVFSPQHDDTHGTRLMTKIESLSQYTSETKYQNNMINVETLLNALRE